VEIVKRNLLYENDPEKFTELFHGDEESFRHIITKAKKLLGDVRMSEVFLYNIAEACAELKVDGQRPDIIIVKTAQTIAALDQRMDVIEKDILLAARFALSHRTRDGGLLEPPTKDEITEAFTKSLQKISSAKTTTGEDKQFSSKSIEIDKQAGSFLDDGDEDDDQTDVKPDDVTLKKKMNRNENS
jgi:Mg-chelatase subunit ChlI